MPLAEQDRSQWDREAIAADVDLVTALNRAVALGEVHGPHAALEVVRELERGQLAGHHRLLAVRAHLLQRAGDLATASGVFRQAARLAGSVPEQRFLVLRAARCASAKNSAE